MPKLIIARPFPSQDSIWSEKAKGFYWNILEAAYKVIDVNPDPFTVRKLFLRNEWMVNHSHIVIAVWDGRKSGGTFACMNYARKLGRQIITIDPTSLNISWQ